MEERILTPEQVAEHLAIPVEVVMEEIYSGRLSAFQFQSLIRVSEFDVAEYKKRARSLVRSQVGSKGSGVEQSESAFRPTEPFQHRWPDGSRESYKQAVEAIVSDGSRDRHIKIGFTTRHVAGMDRRRAVVLVDRYATVEFVGANDFEQSRVMASIVKDSTGKQIPVGGKLPTDYEVAKLDVKGYRDAVVGPRAYANLAVFCKDTDFDAMTKHALIRAKYNEH